MRVSVVVPVYNNSTQLGECLAALRAAAPADLEIIVVDDGSNDGSADVARRAGARVIELPRNSGAAVARNHGARAGGGDVIIFVDSDVVVAAGALDRALQTLADRPCYAAVFGSYDDRPRASGLVTQFRNLLHHFVHQTGASEASTFWAGLGAVRRAAFETVGGFDAGYRAIEDIELGYRLRARGFRILLDKGLLGTHLKRWTLRSMVYADLWLRAVPWSGLILSSKTIPNDLNAKTAQRASIALTAVALGFAFAALASATPRLLAASAAALAGVVLLNREFYGFLLRERGPAFLLASLPLHLIHFVCGGLGFAYACIRAGTSRARSNERR